MDLLTFTKQFFKGKPNLCVGKKSLLFEKTADQKSLTTQPAFTSSK